MLFTPFFNFSFYLDLHLNNWTKSNLLLRLRIHIVQSPINLLLSLFHPFNISKILIALIRFQTAFLIQTFRAINKLIGGVSFQDRTRWPGFLAAILHDKVDLYFFIDVKGVLEDRSDRYLSTEKSSDYLFGLFRFFWFFFFSYGIGWEFVIFNVLCFYIG